MSWVTVLADDIGEGDTIDHLGHPWLVTGVHVTDTPGEVGFHLGADPATHVTVERVKFVQRWARS